MCLDFWGLKKQPFEQISDPSFFYRSAETEDVMSRFNYVVKRNKGAALMTGTLGCGKTTLLIAWSDRLLQDGNAIVPVAGSFPDVIGFLKKIALQLDLHLDGADGKLNILRMIQAKVVQNAQRNVRTIFLIDDAENLPQATLNELSLLLNVLSDVALPATLILSGQPVLKEQIGKLRDFCQRLTMRCRLGGMNVDDTAGYIAHRLQTAGMIKEIFTFEALVKIHDLTEGIPSRINDVCKHCLENGALNGAPMIGVDIVYTIIQEYFRNL